MDKKLLFNDALSSLVEFAAANGNHLSKEDIHTYFKDIIEDESQYELIYSYLLESKINIDGMDRVISEQLSDEINGKDKEESAITSSEKFLSPETKEELAFIEMYMKDLEAIVPATEEEILSLAEALSKGNLSVTERLIEAHLPLVADLAKLYKGQGVTYGDLIQEGNIGLMDAIASFSGNPCDFNDFITSQINISLKNAVDEQINSSRIGEHLAGRMNTLDAISTEMTKELGRAPSFYELADKMGISEDEVETIIKTSLNVLNSGDQTDIGDIINESENNGIDPGDDAFTDEGNNNTASDPLEWRVNKKK